jgi:hypothetical protein
MLTKMSTTLLRLVEDLTDVPAAKQRRPGGALARWAVDVSFRATLE